MCGAISLPFKRQKYAKVTSEVFHLKKPSEFIHQSFNPQDPDPTPTASGFTLPWRVFHKWSFFKNAKKQEKTQKRPSFFLGDIKAAGDRQMLVFQRQTNPAPTIRHQSHRLNGPKKAGTRAGNETTKGGLSQKSVRHFPKLNFCQQKKLPTKVVGGWGVWIYAYLSCFLQNTPMKQCPLMV